MNQLWHRTKGTRGRVEYQLLYNVAPRSFFLQFLPAECRIQDRLRTIDIASILSKLLAA